jgi:hypothetical protein
MIGCGLLGGLVGTVRSSLGIFWDFNDRLFDNPPSS